MQFAAQLITWINVPVNAMGRFLLSPIGVFPGWLSNTIISAVTGVVLLVLFKYTSNQRAIARVRDDIKANMLALKLFKDSIVVTLQSQGRVYRGAFLLLFHALGPMLVMMVPVCLLLVQMGLWYQYRPLGAGEKALVTVELDVDPYSLSTTPRIVSISGAEVTEGPCRLKRRKEICWNIRGTENGCHKITFEVDGEEFEKDLAVGDGFMRISARRPGWDLAGILMNPSEKPFSADSVVRSVSIDYPQRPGLTSGTDRWVIYFFVASMIFAFIFKPFLKVRI